MPLVVIEAAPGSGKTTVAAQRFGCLRYRIQLTDGGSRDHRAVVAVSFTKSATRELRVRTESTWGPSVLQWPHRISTIDAFVQTVVQDLLHSRVIKWPGGHTTLTVHESWKPLIPHTQGYRTWVATYQDDGIAVTRQSIDLRPVPSEADVNAQIANGHCTHDDIRSVLHTALAKEQIRDHVGRRLSETIRCLIVDEVYDANELDLLLVELAAESGCEITIIGDPWQALYGFRGASPEKVPGLSESLAMETLYLSKSFRFRSSEQQELARDLRTGVGVELRSGIAGTDCEIVIAPNWKNLWDTGRPEIVPLAWGAASDDISYGLATVLLDLSARQLTGMGAVFKAEALLALGLTDAGFEAMQPGFTKAMQGIADSADSGDLFEVYDYLAEMFRCSESGNALPAEPNSITLERLWMIGERLRIGTTCVPGVTAHQAKGREWDRVGVCLGTTERRLLQRGLRPHQESHRVLYVACTRARLGTVEIAIR
ncbi:UvrD-helicase domain-containing protein [Nocardia sp. CA-135398]|uniref:UvrD-helicase domain-containing protein n=1 Tax=Nocardia sp. CA-135398 TaxID=3239977 RepID=UPI003D999869